MIESLRIRGYRAFEHFELNDLARVNLLVGKNACGKTSLLEAVQFLATNGSIGSLIATAFRRGEIIVVEDLERSHRDTRADVFQIFHGRKPVSGSSFHICSEADEGSISVELRNENEIEHDDDGGSSSGSPSDDFAFSLDIAGRSYPVSEDGGLLFGGRGLHNRRLRENGTIESRVQMVTAESLEPGEMRKMWDRVIVESREGEVIDAMRILQPGIDGIFFLSGEDWRGGFSPVLVSLGNSRQRVPLGSVGEGMRRLLALSLSLIQAENGVLLVDEIDTGLHYSALGDLWRLIVEAARKSDVQVFATTHSLDCVKALAWLCESYPELGSDVALHKIQSSMDQSVVFDAENMIIAADQGIEVR